MTLPKVPNDMNPDDHSEVFAFQFQYESIRKGKDKPFINERRP
jgi:hypothetical protein